MRVDLMASAPARKALRVRRVGGPWWGMGVVVVTSMAAVTPVFAVASLAGSVEAGVGVSPTGFGMVLSGFFAVTAVGAPVARWVAGHVAVPVVLACVAVVSVVSVVSLVLEAAAGDVAVLAAALVLAGAGNAMAQPAAARYVSARVPRERLSLATGLLGASLGGAPLLPGLLAAVVAGPYGWRAAVLASVALPASVVFLTPLTGTGGRSRPGGGGGRGGAVAAGSGDRSRSRVRVLVSWTVAAALATVGSTGLATYFVQLGTRSGLSASTAGLMQSMAAVVAIAVRVVAGCLADRAPRHNPAVVAAMMAVGAVGLVLVSTGSAVVFVVGAVLAVAGGWGWTGLLLAAVMRLLPGQGARAGAIVTVGLFGGAAAAPVAFGAASVYLGTPVTVLLAAGCVAVGVAGVVAGMRACHGTV